ncbi:MAG: integrase, partial [Proteobacteria bacterium]|nr:integrase [Pseudomonadota bacterium]
MIKRSGLPKHVTTFLDRHGKRRVRGRRHGVTYYFKSAPGTDGFLMEYQEWLAGETPRVEIGATQTKPRSVAALIVEYYQSAEWPVLT